jgi:hypothetical protein
MKIICKDKFKGRKKEIESGKKKKKKSGIHCFMKIGRSVEKYNLTEIT